MEYKHYLHRRVFCRRSIVQHSRKSIAIDWFDIMSLHISYVLWCLNTSVSVNQMIKNGYIVFAGKYWPSLSFSVSTNCLCSDTCLGVSFEMREKAAYQNCWWEEIMRNNHYCNFGKMQVDQSNIWSPVESSTPLLVRTRTQCSSCLFETITPSPTPVWP